MIERLRQLGKACFGLEAKTTSKQGYIEVRFDSVRLVLWWEACGFAKRLPGEGHVGKGYVSHVPDAVLYTNDREIYAGFIRGLYEADGDNSAGYPTLKSTSIGMVRDLQAIHLAMGYPTTLSIKERPKSWGACWAMLQWHPSVC